MEIECVLNYGNRLWGKDDFLDLEFEVEQVVADGFDDGEPLDLAQVELVLGDFKIAADFFLADDLRREGHIGDLLAQFFPSIEKQAFQLSFLASQNEVAAHFLNAYPLFLIESGNSQNMQEWYFATALERHFPDKLNQLSHFLMILLGDGNFENIFKVVEHRCNS